MAFDQCHARCYHIRYRFRCGTFQYADGGKDREDRAEAEGGAAHGVGPPSRLVARRLVGGARDPADVCPHDEVGRAGDERDDQVDEGKDADARVCHAERARTAEEGERRPERP